MRIFCPAQWVTSPCVWIRSSTLRVTTSSDVSWDRCWAGPLLLQATLAELLAPRNRTIFNIRHYLKLWWVVRFALPLTLYASGFQTGVRGSKGIRSGFPGGPREDSQKVSLFARFLTIYDSYVFKFAHISQSLSQCIAWKCCPCNLYVTDDVDTFVIRGVHKNLGIL